MKNLMKLMLSVAVIMVAYGTGSEANAQTGVIRDVIKRMDKAYKSLVSLRANVQMEKRDSVLGESDTYIGKVIYVPKKGRDANIRVDWTKPAETLAVKDGKYIIFKESNRQAYTGSVNDAKGSSKAGSSLAFLNMSETQLRENYSVQLLGEEGVGGEQTWHLLLTPKTKSKQKSADLWVNANGFPIQSRITEQNNDTTTVRLSNLQLNVKVDLAEFTVKLPKDVAWVKQ